MKADLKITRRTFIGREEMMRIGKGLLSLFALFLFMGMFAACSSSEEESSSSGGQSCVDQCPEGQNQDECIILCEA
jgi:hypothetical protein